MSFTSQQQGGKYQFKDMQGVGGGYGLTNQTPYGFGGRLPVMNKQYDQGSIITIDLMPPYISTNIWRRTA